MPDIPDRMLYAGLSVDICFSPPCPQFGDLFQICGEDHPSFPPTGSYGFDRLADLQFSQIDDYLGVKSLASDGDDVVVWLYPMLKSRVVHHHPGPFDAVRLEYTVLRNSVRHIDFFLRCVEAFASLNPQQVLYIDRNISLGVPPDVDRLHEDIAAIIDHWRGQGIEVGSEDALQIDF